MINTLEDFIREYSKIISRGWVKTHRAGPTGIGKTLEDLLGIAENNIDGPDFGDYELKSGRQDAGSMLTIFTKTPLPRGSVKRLRAEFGYSSDVYDNEEKVLHATLSAKAFVKIANTDRCLRIECTDKKISIIDKTGKEWAFWTCEGLQKAFEKKYKNKFVYAKAMSRGEGAAEEFKFVEAYEVSGFSYESFVEMLKDGTVCVDLRIGQYHGGPKNGQTHDHGTAFRIAEKNQYLLFKVKRKICG